MEFHSRSRGPGLSLAARSAVDENTRDGVTAGEDNC